MNYDPLKLRALVNTGKSFSHLQCKLNVINTIRSASKMPTVGSQVETESFGNTSMENLDPFQVALMKEMCIQVDEEDRPLKGATKEDCHLMKNINNGLLHRAFSLFLFNTKGELLLQQRADSKITFPGYYTNTCCSHPLYTPEEMEPKNHLGIKRAIQRRLFQELGISPEEVPLSALHYLTRIHYKSPSDKTWGEHEIDYVFFIQRDVTLKPNPNEVKECRYITKEECTKFLESLDVPTTPWFNLIVKSFLFKWWDHLDDLEKFQDNKIQRMAD